MLKIIINSPYSGNLHLKILSHLLSLYPEAEVVNLSPIRWLQDPLAEYKKNSDWKKFKDIREKITDLDVVKSSTSDKIFGIQCGDLGIYHLTKGNNAWETKVRTLLPKFITEKILPYKDKIADKVKFYDDEPKNFVHVLEVYGGEPSTGSGFIKEYGYKKPKASTSDKVSFSGICFDTEEEAKNFAAMAKTKFFIYLMTKLRSGYHYGFGANFPYLGDYTHPWTDEMLYEYFHLSDDEIREIEKCI